jgi:hypothetical protein
LADLHFDVEKPDLLTWIDPFGLLPLSSPQETKVFEHWGGYISCGRVACSTTKIISLGYVKEVRTTKS